MVSKLRSRKRDIFCISGLHFIGESSIAARLGPLIATSIGEGAKVHDLA